MLVVAGVHHIITMDLHSSLIQGFFQRPVDNLHCEPTFAKFLKDNYPIESCVIVAKNAGGTKRVTSLSDRLGVDFALIHREKYHRQDIGGLDIDDMTNETRLTLVGDVKGKICFLMDDMVDGTHSFLDACRHLKTCQADKVIILAAHGIFSGDSVKEIETSSCVDQVITTNTFPMSDQKKTQTKKIRVIDVSGVIAEAIRRTHNGESISYLFHTAI